MKEILLVSCESNSHHPWSLDCVGPIRSMQVNGFAMSDDLQSGSEAEQHRWSIGSKLHAQGGCKPCAWFWRPGGCHRGDDCKHCHLCPPGALQMRKRQNRELVKALRQQSKVQYETQDAQVRATQAALSPVLPTVPLTMPVQQVLLIAWP